MALLSTCFDSTSGSAGAANAAAMIAKATINWNEMSFVRIYTLQLEHHLSSL